MKKIITILLIILVIFINTAPSIAYGEPNEGHIRLNVKINVPFDFKEDILLFVKDPLDRTENDYSFKLTSADNYKGEYGIKKGIRYNVKLQFKNSDFYSIEGIDSGYDTVENEEIESTITIKLRNNARTTETIESTSDVTTESNITNNDSKEVLNKFIDKCSLMKNNSNYDNFLKNYKGEMFKKYYFEDTVGKTDDDWNNLSEFDSFIFYIAYIYPKSCFNVVKTDTRKSEFLENLYSTKYLLNLIDGGDKISTALDELWSYIWDEYEKTGEFVDLFEDERLNIAAAVTDDSESINDDKTESESKVAVSKKTKKTLFDKIKGSIVTISILIVLGAIIGFLYFKKKRENN